LICICDSQGWQPGIQEGAATWDEDWDKFEDEGMLSTYPTLNYLSHLMLPLAFPISNKCHELSGFFSRILHKY
jgi:hypothetical protein